MDFFIIYLEQALPIMHVLALLAVVAKGVIITRIKGFDVPEITFSFFRIFSGDQLSLTTSRRKRKYMLVNNGINFYLYGWAVISAVFFIITKRFY